MFSTFGVDPWKFAVQFLIFLVPAVFATQRIRRFRVGPPRILWLLIVWTTPLVGAALALVIVRARSQPRLAR